MEHNINGTLEVGNKTSKTSAYVQPKPETFILSKSSYPTQSPPSNRMHKEHSWTHSARHEAIMYDIISCLQRNGENPTFQVNFYGVFYLTKVMSL